MHVWGGEEGQELPSAAQRLFSSNKVWSRTWWMPTFSSLALARLSVNTRDTQPRTQTQPKRTQVQRDPRTPHHTQTCTQMDISVWREPPAEQRAPLQQSPAGISPAAPGLAGVARPARLVTGGRRYPLFSISILHHALLPTAGPSTAWVPFLGQPSVHPAAGHCHWLAVGMHTKIPWTAKVPAT